MLCVRMEGSGCPLEKTAWRVQQDVLLPCAAIKTETCAPRTTHPTNQFPLEKSGGSEQETFSLSLIHGLHHITSSTVQLCIELNRECCLNNCQFGSLQVIPVRFIHRKQHEGKSDIGRDRIHPNNTICSFRGRKITVEPHSRLFVLININCDIYVFLIFIYFMKQLSFYHCKDIINGATLSSCID